DGDGAVAERPLERDAHEPVGAGQKPLRGERRPKDVLEEGLATFLVVGPGSRGGVQAEAHFAYRKRRCDNDAGAAGEGDLHGAAAELGAGGGGGVQAVQEDDVEVRIQLQVGRGALHGDDSATLDGARSDREEDPGSRARRHRSGVSRAVTPLVKWIYSSDSFFALSQRRA